MEQIYNNFQVENNTDYFTLFFSFLLCIICSILLKFVFQSKSSSLTGKYHVGNIIPMMSLTTFLVITVVKSSLALSLGLVGALSVIRFRTPIKEPEELVYLFLAIGIGLGFGANQIVITLGCFLIILFCIYFVFDRKKTTNINDYNFILNWNTTNINSSEILQKLAQEIKEIEIIKYDLEENNQHTLCLRIQIIKIDEIEKIEKVLKDNFKDITYSFYEAKILS